MTKSGDNWKELFEKYKIAERVAKFGHYDITATQFKENNLEARLHTKIDHSHQLPPIMKATGTSILTLTNSSWRIGPFEIFQDLPVWTKPDDSVKTKSLPDWLESLSRNGITGEGALINAASAAGILADFAGEDLTQTITGKSRSGMFDFTARNSRGGATEINVKGAQIEVDAGFEGKSSIVLFEAKRHLSLDFNVRQLLYPYLTFSGRTNKPVRPVFITLANDVFDLAEFKFEDPRDLSSIQLVASARYMLTDATVSEQEIVQIALAIDANPNSTAQNTAPFPQADDFERIIDMTEFVAAEPRSIDDITSLYEFSSRQSDYYFSAARYLGLGVVVKGNDGLNYRQATALGSSIANMPYSEKRLALAQLVLQIPALREIYLAYFENHQLMAKSHAEKIVEKWTRLGGFSGSTVGRRTQTILAWVRWLIGFGRN